MGAGSGKPNTSENKMVGTVSNKIKNMSPKDKARHRRIRLQNMTESEKEIMKRYGKDWTQAVRDTYQ